MLGVGRMIVKPVLRVDSGGLLVVMVLLVGCGTPSTGGPVPARTAVTPTRRATKPPQKPSTVCEDLETAAKRSSKAAGADKALLRAARCYEQSGRIGPAVSLYRLLVRRYTGSSLVPLAMSRMARGFERLAFFHYAAKWYETLAGKHPRNPLAPGALLRALELRAGLEDETEVLALATLLGRLYGARNRKLSARAQWILVRMYDSIGADSTRLSSLTRYLRLYRRVGAADRVLWAASRLASLHWRRSCRVALSGAQCVRLKYHFVGKMFVKKLDRSKPPRLRFVPRDMAVVRKALRYSRLATSLWAGGAVLKRIPRTAARRAERVRRTRRAATRAAFLRLDLSAERLLAAGIPGWRRGGHKRLRAWVAERIKALELLIRAFELVAKRTRNRGRGNSLSEASSTIAMASRAGSHFYLLAQRVQGLTPPRWIRGRSARRRFRVQLRQLAKPLRARALVRYKTCLKLAARHQWWGNWAAQCRRDAAELDPARFPVMREVVPRLGRQRRPRAPALTPKRVTAFLARPGHVAENERMARGLLALGRRAGVVPPRLVAFWNKHLHTKVGPYEAAASHLRAILAARSVATQPDEIADGLRAWALLVRLYHEWSRARPYRSRRLWAELSLRHALREVVRRLRRGRHCRRPATPSALDRALAALHIVRGRLLAHDWHFGEAAEQFRAALRCDAGNRDALMNRAALALQRGDYPLARASYLAALKLSPGDPDALLGLGVTNRSLATVPPGKGPRKTPAQWLALARSRYNAVLKRQPKHPGALFNLGVLLVDHLRLPAEGKKIFARYLRLSPHKHPWGNMQYARHKLGMPPYRPPPKRLRPY